MADHFSLVFTPEQETPPNGSPAGGTGTVSWDSAARAATYEYSVSGVDFGPVLGLGPQTATTTDDVTIAHVHSASSGVAGAIVFGHIGPAQDADDLSITLNDDGSWTVRGVWETTDPANVSIENFADILDAASPGEGVPLYSNIHTTTFPAGEIRAQWIADAGSVGEGEVDWNAIAAHVLANFEATGTWFI